MARDDHDRRRLRALYDRNSRRVSALADARDRRRGGDDDFAAPRRYVVTERRTRVEGFGRGGTQVRRVERRAAGGRAGEPRANKFSDRSIFRRSGRDRFQRADDAEREDRRERSRNERERRGNAPKVQERRIGSALRRRLRKRGARGGADDRNDVVTKGRGQRASENSGRQRNNKGNQPQRATQQNNRSGGGNQQSSQQRNNVQGGGKKNNNQQQQQQQRNNQQQQQQRNNNNNQPHRPREPQMTHADLDRQLESYHN
ncbi:hypothetical protein NESM_000117000 [Novymonas esmeraldas]|uniref:Chromatin target of PRMT1 protein C-terminal domain-containing protein n=1 Tax=Novymonas esmeraldas TaxID=1808958 RepID=A0AAW0F5X3_9TRYP